MTSFIVALAMLAQAASAPRQSESRVPPDGGVGGAVVVSTPSMSRPVPPWTQAQAAVRAAPAADEWFAADKVRHFGVAFAVTGLAYAGLRALDVDRDAALAGAGATALMAGLGKELYDRHIGRGFSIRDLVWDLAGTAAAMVLLDRAR